MEVKRFLTGRNGPGLSLAVTSRPPVCSHIIFLLNLYIYPSVNSHRPWQIGGRSMSMCPLKIVFCHINLPEGYSYTIYINILYTLYIVLDNLNPLFFACSCFFCCPKKSNAMKTVCEPWQAADHMGWRPLHRACFAGLSEVAGAEGPAGWHYDHYGLRGFPSRSHD